MHPNLTPEQKKFYEEIVIGRRSSLVGPSAVVGDSGELLGPFGILIYEPVLGSTLQKVGEVLRFSSALSDRLRESIILLVAAFHSSGCEWNVHVELARASGICEEDLVLLGQCQRPSLLEGVEIKIFDIARDVVMRQVSETTIIDLDSDTESPLLIHALTLVYYYGLLAELMNIFGVESKIE